MEVARRRRDDNSIWLVAGMRVKAKNIYEALFVNDVIGRYRQCVVYSILEDLWYERRDEDKEEGCDLDSDFEFYFRECQGMSEPGDVDKLLTEIEFLTGPVTLEKTGCQICGDFLDVKELSLSSCCESLLCRDCRIGSGENCIACGEELSPVEVLALLADS